MTRTFTFLFVFGVFGGCGEDNDCYLNNYQNITDYEISPNLTTPSGIPVDSSGFDVDLEELDRQIDEMEICVQNALAGGIDLATAEARDCRDSNGNYRTDFSDIAVHRDCLTVKIAPDWDVSSCSEEYMEVFPCDMPAEVCENKGLEVTEECPCRCRSTIQDENTVVTTPNLYLFRGELARMMTGCNNPWFRPVSRCLLD